jgi:hypothetical protein
MRCPECCGELIKKEGSGEGVKACSVCDASWFLLECKRGQEVENKLEAALKQVKQLQELLGKYQPS